MNKKNKEIKMRAKILTNELINENKPHPRIGCMIWTWNVLGLLILFKLRMNQYGSSDAWKKQMFSSYNFVMFIT